MECGARNGGAGVIVVWLAPTAMEGEDTGRWSRAGLWAGVHR